MEHFFYIRFSKLGERFDPSVYRARFEYISKIFPNVKLNEIAYIDPATYFDKYPRDMQISFVPMDSINATYGTIETQQTIAISQSKGYTRFQEGDLLWAKITPCMQNGKSAIAHNLVNGFGCGSTEFFVIRPKNSQIVLSEYLYILLRNEKVLQGAMNFFGGSAGQQRVSPIFLRDFIIPLPDVAVQRDIIARYFRALTLKRQQEQEADRLIQSIDDYILSELGIERPERTENGRFFYTSFKEITGGELAPISVQNRGKQSKSTQYKEIKLSTIASITKGQAITSKEIVDGEYPVIAGGQSSPYTHNQYNHKGDVITISASGAYSGYVWYHDYPIFASDCSVIFSKDNNVFLTKYIYEILRVRQKEIYLLQKGAGQPHVYASDLAQITIPVVSIEKQMEIILHCNNLRIAAAELTQEGKNLVESAKMTIEAMILGE